MPLPTSLRPALPPGAPEYCLSPDILLVEAPDGTARLLDLRGTFYAVTAVGALMLRETLACGVDAAAARVCEHFSADPEEVRADLRTFLDNLARMGLVRRARRPHAQAGRPGPPALTRVLGSLVLGVHRGARTLETRAWVLLALARLSLRFLGWARTVAVWRQVPSRAARPMASNEWGAAAHKVGEAVSRIAASHALAVGCKERSLCCWSLLRAAGVPAVLTVGVVLFPFEGHCWCHVGHWVVGDDPDECKRFTIVTEYE